MTPAKRDPTIQVYWRIDLDAMKLLNQLEPNPHRRGQYVSELIRQEARRAGLLPPEESTTLDLEVLQRQLQELQTRVSAALDKQKNQESAA